jgi:hypothetical protein
MAESTLVIGFGIVVALLLTEIGLAARTIGEISRRALAPGLEAPKLWLPSPP